MGESLGFVKNPDRREVYHVQEGLGVSKANYVNWAFQNAAEFFETKRNSSEGDNKNNGLVLVFQNEEDFAVWIRIVENLGHKNLLLDSVKGFGILDHVIERNKSKNFAFSGPKFKSAQQVRPKISCLFENLSVN